MSGGLHPSLRAYIDCFDSAPWPKVWPRGGGIWDQDPILVRDFRTIRGYELQWKQTQEQMAQMKNQNPEMQQDGGGPGAGLEDLLNDYLEEMGESGTY